MMLIQDFYDKHVTSESCTIRLKGNWETEERIDTIKRVNHIEGKYLLRVTYIQGLDETIVVYKIEY